MNQNIKTLLIVNTGYDHKRFIFKQLKRRKDLRIVVLNKEINWAAQYVDEWIIADTFSHRLAVEAVVKYSHKNRIDGVITFWEDDVLLTSKIVDELHLTGIPHQIAINLRNKFKMREFCESIGVATPKHTLVNSEDELKVAVENFKFPVVIKPTLGSMSSYVVKAEDSDEVFQIWKYIRQNINVQTESSLHDGIQLLMEEFIEGDEVDVDLLIQNGKTKFWSITDNLSTQEPYFIESGMICPSNLPDSQQKELLSIAENVLERAGVRDGCIHFEAKYSKTGPVPIEVNLRMGGDEVYWLPKQVWHVDMIDSAVKIALGEYFPTIVKPQEPFSYMASTNFVSERSAILSSYSVPESWPKELRVDQYYFYKEVGDSVLAPPDGFEYLGWMTAMGDNPIDASENLEEAKKLVQFEVIPFSSLSVIGKTKRSSRFKSAKVSQQSIMGEARLIKLRASSKKKQRQLNIGIACNRVVNGGDSVESEIGAVGTTIEQTLNEIGYKTTYVDFNNLPEAISVLQTQPIDLVFNVGERINGSSLLEPHIASILDAMQIPYTGSNPFTLGFCIDKIRVKKLLTYHQIPTAKWDYMYEMTDKLRTDFVYPLIVKPGNSDDSIGITQESVVTNEKELKRQLEYMLHELKRPALIEEYLPGDEYAVSILGNENDDLRVLPLDRTIYDKFSRDRWHILTFEDKYGEDINLDNDPTLIVERPPKNVSSKLIKLISEISLDTFLILGAHDYGRVDVKLDQSGNPHVLELNPNPSINRGRCVPEVAEIDGLSYPDFLEKIISLAINRYRDERPYAHLQPVIK
ncbi:MAG: hypothetical protein COU65_03400 [Candidatus Pacebacteria bacterium CG10_big_fil_rev_8_21_14_0_10_42_12]|nr:MAG: hypothetical protein COU65_03400 [Candidatus Pacebacteria bacterium CG10_big_fil_rev_8_21_14_0_10_42_12]